MRPDLASSSLCDIVAPLILILVPLCVLCVSCDSPTVVLCTYNCAVCTQAMLSKAVKDSDIRMLKVLIEEDELEVTEEVKATGDWREDYDKCVLKHISDKVRFGPAAAAHCCTAWRHIGVVRHWPMHTFSAMPTCGAAACLATHATQHTHTRVLAREE